MNRASVALHPTEHFEGSTVRLIPIYDQSLLDQVLAYVQWRGPISAQEIAMALTIDPRRVVSALVELWRAGHVESDDMQELTSPQTTWQQTVLSPLNYTTSVVQPLISP